MGKAQAPMSTAWMPMRPGASASLGSDVGATACHRCHCSVTSVPGSLRLCSAFCWLCDLSDAASWLLLRRRPLRRQLVFMEDQSVDEDFGFEINGRERDDIVTGATVTSVSSPREPTRRGSVEGDDPRPSDVVADDPEVPDAPDVPSFTRRRAEGQRSLVPSSTLIPDECLESSGVDIPMRDELLRDPDDPLAYPEDLIRPSVGGSIPLNDEDPDLPPGRADVSPCSSSSDLQASSDESDDENVSVEVEQTRRAKKVKKKAKAKNRADAPPAGYMTLFENYFDQCLLWFPLPRFLMRYLAIHGVCLAQINPRGIRHLLGIYVLTKECGVDISTENLSFLTDFRTRGLSEELKHSVTNSSGMALIAGFPSKDDHFEYRFFFAEISERTVEAEYIDLVKTRWERRVKPTMPKVSKEFLAAMHKELSSGNGNWRRSFSRKRIERALSAEILPRKVLGRGQARLSLREQIALEAAAKARGSSGTGAPGVAMPTTSTPLAPSTRARTSRPSAPKTALPPPSSDDVAEFRRLSAERAHISSGKGKGVDRVTPSKRQRADAFPAAAIGREASVSGGDGLLRAEAYSVVKSRYSEFSLLFDRLVGDYDKDVRSRGSELSAANEVNAALQSRLNETVERNEALERDALALQRVKKDYEDKLSKLKSRCAKAEGETVRLRGELSSASDLQRARVDAAVAEARDEMTRSFVVRTSEVAGLLAEIGGKVQNDMLNLTEIDANLEFIGLLQGSDLPVLPTEVETLRQRRHPIYDAHDVFADLLAGVLRVLEIPTAPAGAVETSAAVDDEVELSDKDDVEATGDEGADD
ncbi:hypothetical protein AALP_AA8G153300 [Arabis alpina]|uniref:Uncharacterized protein n=1 Tax=Arabis alpina TaxID=50452 RepID=A0A087G787_ARAAL|nr:hypothetical protein AALP_AA8G153300 [Arabis alpina]